MKQLEILALTSSTLLAATTQKRAPNFDGNNRFGVKNEPIKTRKDGY